MNISKQLNKAFKDPNSFTATVLIILPCLFIFSYALYKGLALPITLIIAVLTFFTIKSRWQQSIYTNKAISKKFKTQGYSFFKKIKTPKLKDYFTNIAIGSLLALILLILVFSSIDRNTLSQIKLFSPFNIFIFIT